MSEFSKFLRYIIPGLIFGFEYVLLIFSSNYTCFSELLRSHSEHIINAGSAAVALLTAGGIGFIFSAIHHVIFHIVRRFNIPFLRIDHLKTLKAAEKKNLISFEKIEDTDNISAEDLSQSGAWRILTYYWNSQLNVSKAIKASDVRTKSLTDLLHGTGTNLVANIVALTTAGLTIYYLEIGTQFFQHWIVIIIALCLFLTHLLNHFFVIRDCEGVINAIILQDLAATKKSNKLEVRLFVSEKDMEWRWLKWFKTNVKRF